MIANHNVIEKEKTDKNMQIEGLRGIAIIIVCIYHLVYRYNQLYGLSNVELLHHAGTLGVGFFILISGFFCCQKVIIRLVTTFHYYISSRKKYYDYGHAMQLQLLPLSFF